MIAKSIYNLLIITHYLQFMQFIFTYSPLAVNCTEDPPIVQNNDRGMFDWTWGYRNLTNTTALPKSFGTSIRYS